MSQSICMPSAAVNPASGSFTYRRPAGNRDIACAVQKIAAVRPAVAVSREPFWRKSALARLESSRDRRARELLDVVDEPVGCGGGLLFVADGNGAYDCGVMPCRDSEIARLAVMQIIEAPRHGIARHHGTGYKGVARAFGQEILQLIVVAQIGQDVISVRCTRFQPLRHIEQLRAFPCGAPTGCML